MMHSTNYAHPLSLPYRGDLDFLRQVAEKYPVSTYAHFLYLYELKQQGKDWADRLPKAALSFKNPWWVNYQLQLTLPASLRMGENDQNGDENTDYNSLNDETHGNQIAAAQQGEPKARIAEEEENRERVEFVQAPTIGEEAGVKGEIPETGGPENMGSGLSNAREVAVDEQSNYKDESLVADESGQSEAKKTAPFAQVEANETATGLVAPQKLAEEAPEAREEDPETIEDLVAPGAEEETEGPSETNEEEKLEDAGSGVSVFGDRVEATKLTPEKAFPASNPEGVQKEAAHQPVQQESKQENLTGIPAEHRGSEVEFEPLHAVDYFASQGITIREEDLKNDTLSKQVKSFTAWLKTMKTLHPDKIPRQNEVVEKIIETSAEESNADANILTEAMAEVLLKQNKREKAIEMFEKLSLMNPAKSAYFAAKIESIKNSTI